MNPRDERERAVSAIRVLVVLARLLERTSDEAGLSLPQYRVLSFMSKAPRRAGLLAEMASVSRTTLTSTLDGLEQRGLLVREPVPGDRRGVSLRLTAEGEDAMLAVEERIVDRLAAAPLGAHLDDLLGALAGVGESLSARTIDAAPIAVRG